MRITNKMLATSFMTDMNRNLNNLKTLQQQMTSGKEVRLPSDDPFKVARAMQLHTDIASNKQYNKNIEDTINFLDVTDTALNQTTNVLQRVNELLVSAGNAAYGSSERQAIKDEINQKVSELGQILNSSFDGKYVFGGTRGTTKPIKVTGGITYSNSLSVKPNTDEVELKKWQNTKLTIGDIEIDFGKIGEKPSLDKIASEINSQIKNSGSSDADKIKVVTNNKTGEITFINETGKDLDLKVEKRNDKVGEVPGELSGIAGTGKITQTVKKDNGNTKLEYNSRDGGEITEAEKIIMGEKLTTEVSQGVIIEYNVTATEVLQYTDKDGNKKDLMELLTRITNHLDGKDAEGVAGDPDAMDKLLQEDLTDLKGAIQNMLTIRSEVGAKQNRMDSAKDKNIEQNFNLTEILSSTEDIDITEKTMEYAVLQSVYLASLQTSAKILQPTLMDYLR